MHVVMCSQLCVSIFRVLSYKIDNADQLFQIPVVTPFYFLEVAAERRGELNLKLFAHASAASTNARPLS